MGRFLNWLICLLPSSDPPQRSEPKITLLSDDELWRRDQAQRELMRRENPFPVDASPSGRHASASPGGYAEALKSGRNVAR